MNIMKRALPVILLSAFSVALAPSSVHAAKLGCLFNYTRGICDDGTIISCFDGSGNLSDCDQATADRGCEGHGGLANLVSYGEATAAALSYGGNFTIGDDGSDLEEVGAVLDVVLYAECPDGEEDVCEDGETCSEAPEELVCDGTFDPESAVYAVSWQEY